MKREEASGIGHVKDREQRGRSRHLVGDVPAATVASEHRADKIAASLRHVMGSRMALESIAPASQDVASEMTAQQFDCPGRGRRIP